ncbi:hypothetical protein ACQEVF_56430 [Nonomuraea polychroma]|uniref:hypothetical protein n=1 Tax=Nonomuraea polychroma TaxID=46176 RepID=UPI003D8B88F8
MGVYGTGGAISVKIFSGDTTAVNTGWDVELEQAESYISHLTVRFQRPADWAALAGYDTPFVTETFGEPEQDPGAHICVTLAHDDGTEVRALWQIGIEAARRYVRELAVLHGDLPHWSMLHLKGRPLAEFRLADDGSEPLDIS